MSRRRRRITVVAVALIGAYLGFLALGGLVFGGCVEERARERLARALGAEVTIGSTSLSVWRGELELEEVVALRKDGGALELRIDSVEVDVAGWGAVIVDRDVDRVHVRGAHMMLSARGLADVVRIERTREPVLIGELVVEDATLAIMPTAFLPGLGRVE